MTARCWLIRARTASFKSSNRSGQSRSEKPPGYGGFFMRRQQWKAVSPCSPRSGIPESDNLISWTAYAARDLRSPLGRTFGDHTRRGNGRRRMCHGEGLPGRWRRIGQGRRQPWCLSLGEKRWDGVGIEHDRFRPFVGRMQPDDGLIHPGRRRRRDQLRKVPVRPEQQRQQ